MKLVTNICNEFVELRFTNDLGYIVINWRKNAVFTLSHKLTEIEVDICNEIMINLSWIEIGESIHEKKGEMLYGNYTK